MSKRVVEVSMAAVLTAALTTAHAAPTCGSDVEACARLLAVENAGYMDACGAAFPAAKPLFERVIKGWPVLKFNVPGLKETVREGSPARTTAAFDANEILRTMSPEERNNTCSARLATLTKSEQSMSGTAGSLSAEALKKYAP